MSSLCFLKAPMPRCSRPTVDEPDAAVERVHRVGTCSCTTGGPMAFRHELARQVIDASIHDRRRSRLHRRIFGRSARDRECRCGRLRASRRARRRCGRGACGSPRLRRAERRRWELIMEAVAQYERALRFAGGLPAGRAGVAARRVRRRAHRRRPPADALEASTDALACWRESGDRVGLGTSLLQSRRGVASRRTTARRHSPLRPRCDRGPRARRRVPSSWRACVQVVARTPPGPGSEDGVPSSRRARARARRARGRRGDECPSAHRRMGSTRS